MLPEVVKAKIAEGVLALCCFKDLKVGDRFYFLLPYSYGFIELREKVSKKKYCNVLNGKTNFDVPKTTTQIHLNKILKLLDK